MSKKFDKENFIRDWFSFSYDRRRKYRGENEMIRAVYLKNRKRIDPILDELMDSKSNLTYYQAFKELVREKMFKKVVEGKKVKFERIRTVTEALDHFSRTNYFTDQEERGQVAWHAALKGNAPDVYNQFQRELQKNWHEKYDLRKWKWEEKESTWNRQIYSYEKVRYLRGKDGKIYGVDRYKIYIAQTNSPNTYELLNPNVLGNESPIEFLRKKYAKRAS